MTASPPEPAPPWAKALRLGVGLALLAGMIVWLTPRSEALRNLPPPVDFVEYWAAGRLNAAGQNPYDPGQMFPLQNTTGSEHVGDKAIMMWNPPWTLALVMPLGLLPSWVGIWVWSLTQAAAVLIGVDMLWRVYDGPSSHRWVGWLLGLTFVPSMLVMSVGQISGLLFLGLAGFLYFQERGQPFAAGLLAALAGIKPHLFMLFWAALLLDALYRRQGQAILGGLLAGAVASVIALLPNPQVFAHFFQLLTDPLSPELLRPLASFANPTPGYWLRQLLDPGRFWPQFAVCAVGLVWLPWYWWPRRHDWDWARQLPLLVLVSFLTSPYGAWRMDMVVLLVPLVPLALYWYRRAQRSGLILASLGYLATQVGWVISYRTLTAPDSQKWCIWAPLLLLGVYGASGILADRPARDLPQVAP